MTIIICVIALLYAKGVKIMNGKKVIGIVIGVLLLAAGIIWGLADAGLFG